MSESRKEHDSKSAESKKSEEEAYDPYWWSNGGKPSEETMKRYKEAKPQCSSTRMPIDVTGEIIPTLQETNDGTERVYRDFASPEEARLFSKNYMAVKVSDVSKQDVKPAQSQEASVAVDFPLDEQYMVISPGWKPNQ